MSSGNVIPGLIDGTKYPELHAAAQVVAHLDGDGRSFGVDVLRIADGVLKRELVTYNVVAYLRIDTQGEGLLQIGLPLAVLVHVGLLHTGVLIHPHELGVPVGVHVNLHTALITDDKFALQNGQLTHAVGTVTDT